MDFLSLANSAGGVAWALLFFVVGLSVIVFIHEYGHYIVGRLTGIHAEVFSLGFGKVLWSRVDRRGTRWQLAAVPFGGYVKFMGDKDAASAKDETAMAGLSDSEKRRTMHGAPLWARALTVAAGPFFNFILAIAVYLAMFAWFGVATDKPVVGKLRPVPFEGQFLQPQDQILAINGQLTPDMEAFLTVSGDLPAAATVDYKILRAGTEQTITGPHPFLPIVGAVSPKSAALDAGLQAGDVILEAAGKPVTAFKEMPALVEATGGAPIALKIWREGDILDITLTPNRRDLPNAEGGFDTRWLIGLSGGILFEPELRNVGILEGMGLALNQAWYVASASLSGMWHVVTGMISTCNLSGPVGMAQVMGDAAKLGPETFFSMIAAMSLGIGLLNLFPIPVLDGGHLVFYAYEAVFRRPPSERALRLLMTAGLALVLSFMVFALTNDLTCS